VGGNDGIIARHFEDHAADYAAHVAPCFDPVAGHLLAELSRTGRRPALIVDVGCGDGRLAARLAPVCRVAGVDRSSALLRRARSRSRAVSWIRADAHLLPFPGSCADVVVCSMSLPFFARPRVALAEMARIARPGGLIVIASGQAPALAARRAVRLATEVRFAAADELAGFFSGQVPAPGGPPALSADKAAEVIAGANGEFRLHLEMTVMYLDPATIGGYCDESQRESHWQRGPAPQAARDRRPDL
jgi:SAM-dependent methyltransferase